MIGEIFIEAFSNSLNTVVQIAMIVIPLMIVLRFARQGNVLNKISSFFEPLTKKIYLSKEATFPLIVGLVFGITYGAGVILHSAKEGNLEGKDIFLLTVFLSINHAIFEDTLLFMAVGANGLIILMTRFIAAILTTYFLGRWLYSRKAINSLINNEQFTIDN